MTDKNYYRVPNDYHLLSPEKLPPSDVHTRLRHELKATPNSRLFYVVLGNFGEGYFLGVYDNPELAIKVFKEWWLEQEGDDLESGEYHLKEHSDWYSVELKVPDEDEIGLDYGDFTAILKVHMNEPHSLFVGG